MCANLRSSEAIVSVAQAARWTALWMLPGLETRVVVKYSRRMRSSLGRCIPARRIVRLNARVLERRPGLFEEVLCHELAHVAVFELHGSRTRPHGPEWAALMRMAGFKPRVRLDYSREPETASDPRRPEVLIWEHRCSVCQTTRLACRPVSEWRCAACVAAGLDGELIVTKRNVQPK